MPKFTFDQLIGGVMVLTALGVVAYASVIQGNVAAMTALVGALGAGVSYFLRGKVEAPK